MDEAAVIGAILFQTPDALAAVDTLERYLASAKCGENELRANLFSLPRLGRNHLSRKPHPSPNAVAAETRYFICRRSSRSELVQKALTATPGVPATLIYRTRQGAGKGRRPATRIGGSALRRHLLRNHFGLREEQKVVTAAGFRVCA